jgi:nucleoside-diphosphate-sugar epimerase
MTLGTLAGERVLVTGGAGFIGSHLVEGLLADGAVVRVLDDLSTGKPGNLTRPADVELMVGDIRNPALCERACAGVRVVFHEAAICSVPRSLQDPGSTIAINVSGAANVFAAARASGADRVVYASSSSVYGDSTRLPQREGEEGEPLSLYAVSKRMDEELAASYARCFGMTLVGLRYFNVCGARQDPNGPYAAVVPRFFDACAKGEPPIIFGDGLQTRDFVYVGDVVRANLLAATAKLTGASVMNIGGGNAVTVNDLAEAICRVSGRSDLTPIHEPARAGDIVHSVADCTRAAELLGFRAAMSLADGLARIAADR